MSKYNPVKFHERYIKDRERLLPIRRAYNADYFSRPEVIESEKKRNATPERKAYRKAYKRTEAGRLAQKRYNQKPEVKAKKKDYVMRVRYGITYKEYESMVARCHGKCDICGKIESPLHIDHDHKSGKIRGLLCGNCNRILGLAHDDPGRLSRAKEYLNAFQRDNITS